MIKRREIEKRIYTSLTETHRSYALLYGYMVSSLFEQFITYMKTNCDKFLNDVTGLHCQRELQAHLKQIAVYHQRQLTML